MRAVANEHETQDLIRRMTEQPKVKYCVKAFEEKWKALTESEKEKTFRDASSTFSQLRYYCTNSVDQGMHKEFCLQLLGEYWSLKNEK